MNSKGATLDGATIICPEDKVEGFKYQVGESFTVKPSTVQSIHDKLLDVYKGFIYHLLIQKETVFFTIDSYCVDCYGELCYRLSTQDKDSAVSVWQCTEEELERDFYKVTHKRFALLEE